MSDLSEFQKDVLTVVSGEPVYGLGIKRELELRYGEEVNHSRLYPNLDSLVEEGLVSKRSRDDRTNEYELTDEGRKILKEDLLWRMRGFVGDCELRAREIRRVLDGVDER